MTNYLLENQLSAYNILLDLFMEGDQPSELKQIFTGTVVLVSQLKDISQRNRMW